MVGRAPHPMSRRGPREKGEKEGECTQKGVECDSKVQEQDGVPREWCTLSRRPLMRLSVEYERLTRGTVEDGKGPAKNGKHIKVCGGLRERGRRGRSQIRGGVKFLTGAGKKGKETASVRDLGAQSAGLVFLAKTQREARDQVCEARIGSSRILPYRIEGGLGDDPLEPHSKE